MTSKVERQSLVQEVIAEVLEIDLDEVTSEVSIVDDLGADSLDLVDVSFTLGKRFGIKMPTKTTLVFAGEYVEDGNLFANGGKITAAGSRLLVASPNLYLEGEVPEGTTVFDVFSKTNVRHWVNLVDFIAEHESKNGDVALQDFLSEFCESENIDMATA